MKKLVVLAITLAGLSSAGSALAIEGSVTVGEHYRNTEIGLGTGSTGLFARGQWMDSDHDGDVGALGLGYNLAIGSLMLSPEAKVLYVNPQDSKEGYTVAVGSGASLPLGKMFSLNGSYFYSPEAFSNRLGDYQEATAGISFSPISILSLSAGYKYQAIDGKDNHKDNVLADGPWIGAALRF